MTEDPNRREPLRLTTSTRAAAMWLAFLAVVLGGVLLLTLWSTGLAAHRSSPWRWIVVAIAALGFLVLAWAIITAFGVFTHASASPEDSDFLPVRPPRFVMRRGSQSGSDLEDLLYRTALNLGPEVTFAKLKPGQSQAPQGEGKDSAGRDLNQPPAPVKTEPDAKGSYFELKFDLVSGWVVFGPPGWPPDVGKDNPQDDGNRAGRKPLILPSAAASGLLVPRNHWIARVWLRAAGQRVAIGALVAIVAVLLLASGRVAQPSSGPVKPAPSPTGTARSTAPPTGTVRSASSATGGPTASPTRTGGSSAGGSTPSPGGPLGQALLTNVVGGVAPVLADTLAPALGSLATQAANTVGTPDELQKKLLDLAVNDIAAPFLHAGSETLGDAVGDALAGKVGLKQKPSAPPSKKAVAQVKTALQKKLAAELASMRSLNVIADYVGLSPSELADKIAGMIAQRQASGLAAGLVRLPQSGRLNNSSLIPFIEQVIKRLVPSQSPQPPPAVAYTVQPGDSLWGISQQLLGPTTASREIARTWQLIYRDNHATIGTDPNHLVPGQVLHIPSTRESALSQGWVLLPWLVAAPGTLTGIAIRRRRRSKRAKERRT